VLRVRAGIRLSAVNLMRDPQAVAAHPPSQFKSTHEANTGYIALGFEVAIAGGAILTGGKTMTAELEVVVGRL
jgi:hypothetical protein